MGRFGLAFFIGRRYLFSKKSHNAINVITAISMVGVAVVTAAMVIVLSVFNGFEGLVISLYSTFDPPIVVSPVEGKSFLVTNQLLDSLKAVEGVDAIEQILEENCMLRYRDRQYFATLKGVSTGFIELSGLGKFMTEGTAQALTDSSSTILLGQGVAYHLSANINDPINPIELYVPTGVGLSIDPTKAFKSAIAFPSGVFSVQHDVDVRYALVPIGMARSILNKPSMVSSLAISLQDGQTADDVKVRLSRVLGPAFIVLDRFEQHALLYSIMRSEKWAVYMILAFILLISIFNVTGSLTMLIIEKKRDLEVLRSMGANNSVIRQIFLSEGMFITLLGAGAGLAIGLCVCWIQATYGPIKLNTDGSYVVQSYPVIVKWADTVNVGFTVILIGLIASAIPVLSLIKEKPTLRIA